MAQATARSDNEDAFGKQLARKRKRGVSRVLGWGALAIFVGMAGYAVLTTKGRQDTRTLLESVPTAYRVVQNPNLIFDSVGSDHVNVLLIGEDRNWKQGKVFNPRTGKYAPFQVIDEDTPPRADTMIIASLNRSTGKIRMVSLPRDARVRYFDSEGKRHRVKLNAIYSLGGSDRQQRVQTLRDWLTSEMGIRVDRTAVIKLEAFNEIVDMVGGVYVDVDGALELKRGKLVRGPIKYKDNWGQWSVDLKPGKQWLNGEEAHGYVRYRYDREGDPGRIRRQQQVMQAIVRRMKEKPVWELPQLAKDIQQKFNADLTTDEMASLAIFAKKSEDSGQKISPLTTYGIYARDNSDVILNETENKKLFTVIFGSSFDPNRYLKNSPTVEEDSIGHTNNRNPAAREVLIEAGLIKPDEEPEKNAILDAPVR